MQHRRKRAGLLKTVLLGPMLGAGLAVASLGSALAGPVPTVYIGTAVNGGAVTTQGSGSPSGFGISAKGALTSGFSYNVSASGTPDPNIGFSSNSTQLSTSTAGTFSVYVTETNLNKPLGSYNMLSGFTSNIFNGKLTSLTETTWVDPNNGQYSLVDQLGAHSFNGISTFDHTMSTPKLTGPYSLTEVFTLTSTGTGKALGTITMTDVPEPGSLALLGTGLLGLGLIGRRRRRKA